MAKIPLYNQGQIQSSRVGVPDMGNAMQGMAQTAMGLAASQGTTSLASSTAFAGEQAQTAQQNTSFAIQQNAIAMQGLQQNLQAFQQAHNERVRQDMAVQKAQQEALDNVSAARLKMDLGTRVSELQAEARERFKDNPDAAPEWFKAASDSEIQKMLKGAAFNDNVKQKAMQATYGDMEQSAKGLTDWKYSQRTANEIGRAGTDAERLSQLPDNKKDFMGLHGQLDQIEYARKNIWAGALGESAANKLAAQATKAATENLLAHMAETDPQQLIDRVKDGQFDQFGLSEKEKQGFLKDAEQQKKSNEVILHDKEQKAQVAVDHKIMNVEFKSNLDVSDPQYMAASIAARNDLRKMYVEVSKDPPSQANLEIKNRLKAAIDKQDTQIDKARARVQSQEDRTERMAAKSDRESQAKERAADKAEREKEKAEKQAAIDKYDSPDGQSKRVKIEEALNKIHNPEGTPNSLKLGGKSGMPAPSDWQTFKNVQEATKLVREAHENGYLNKPGTSDKYYETQISYLGTLTKRLAQKGVQPSESEMQDNTPSPKEKQLKAQLAPPPQTIISTFGDTPETRQTYFKWMDAGVNAWKKAHGGQEPSDEDIRKHVRPKVDAKMLTKGR